MSDKYFLKKMSNEDLVYMTQKQYFEYCRMFYYECKKCKNIYEYDDLVIDNNYEENIKCKSCGSCISQNKSKINYSYYNSANEHFKFMFFDELLNRYEKKLLKDCQNILDENVKKETLNELRYIFFKAVMNYNSSTTDKYIGKFSTYMWGAIIRRHVDIERRKGWVKKNNAIKCQICGKYTGIINNIHLMNIKNKYAKSHNGYIGHSKFHETILGNIEKSIEWTDKQKQEYLKKNIVYEYQRMFPEYPLEQKNISLEEPLQNGGQESNSLYSYLPAESNDSIFEFTDNIIYEDYIFNESCMEQIKNKYPSLYSYFNKNKIIQKIGFNYKDLDEKDFIKKTIGEISNIIAKEILSKDIIFRNKYIKNNGEINKNFIEIIAKCIELHIINDYSLKQICTYIGHYNITESEIKFWINKLKNNKNFANIISKI